jgi:hypothetical protein
MGRSGSGKLFTDAVLFNALLFNAVLFNDGTRI